MRNDKFRVLEIAKKEEGSGADLEVLQCGEVIARSGIYQVVHGKKHGEAEGASVVALRGEQVQPCNTCGRDVQFRLIYAAPHVSEDADFASEEERN